MKSIWKRFCTVFLSFVTLVRTSPITQVYAESKQYWTESTGHVGFEEKVINDGSISESFNEGHLVVVGDEAYCIDTNTTLQPGYKTRVNASTCMNADQTSDVALSIV